MPTRVNLPASTERQAMTTASYISRPLFPRAGPFRARLVRASNASNFSELGLVAIDMTDSSLSVAWKKITALVNPPAPKAVRRVGSRTATMPPAKPAAKLRAKITMVSDPYSEPRGPETLFSSPPREAWEEFAAAVMSGVPIKAARRVEGRNLLVTDYADPWQILNLPAPGAVRNFLCDVEMCVMVPPGGGTIR